MLAGEKGRSFVQRQFWFGLARCCSFVHAPLVCVSPRPKRNQSAMHAPPLGGCSPTVCVSAGYLTLRSGFSLARGEGFWGFPETGNKLGRFFFGLPLSLLARVGRWSSSLL